MDEIVCLSKLRESRGLTQKTFANEIGVSSGIIGMYETGERTPSLKNAKIIANYFSVPIENISFSNRKEG